jgi:hypothetical protein
VDKLELHPDDAIFRSPFESGQVRATHLLI